MKIFRIPDVPYINISIPVIITINKIYNTQSQNYSTGNIFIYQALYIQTDKTIETLKHNINIGRFNICSASTHDICISISICLPKSQRAHSGKNIILRKKKVEKGIDKVDHSNNNNKKRTDKQTNNKPEGKQFLWTIDLVHRNLHNIKILLYKAQCQTMRKAIIRNNLYSWFLIEIRIVV